MEYLVTFGGYIAVFIFGFAVSTLLGPVVKDMLHVRQMSMEELAKPARKPRKSRAKKIVAVEIPSLDPKIPHHDVNVLPKVNTQANGKFDV